MKKLLALFLIVVLCISLSACNTGNDTNEITDAISEQPVKEVKAKITNNDGETEYLSSQELCAIYEENQAKYDNKYSSGQVTITGTVKSVSEELTPMGTSNEYTYEIILEEGWSITVLQESHEEVIDFSAGDKITVTSQLYAPFGNNVRLLHISYFGDSYDDKTTITY